MKKALLIILTTVVGIGTRAQDCTELFISEYVVGSGNNRALELYNPTDAPMSLDGYKVGRFRDGSGTPMLQDLTGMGSVPAFGTYVIVVDKRDPNGTGFDEPVDLELQAVADTFVNPVYVQSDSPFYFNGDDAVPLIKGTDELLDLVGRIGEDPGTAWSDQNGTWWTVDKTLIRKQSVLIGDSDGLDEFLPEVEWDSLPENTFTELGWHTCDCAKVGVNDVNAGRMNLFPNPAVDGQIMLSTSQQMAAIRVFNALGSETASVVFGNDRTDRHRFDLAHLEKGMYMMQVTLKSGAVISRKVMLGQ